MAAVDLAAKRYAQAAFELAVEHGTVDEWMAALEGIAAFMGETEVRRALENTRVTREAKQRLVEAGLRDLSKLPLNLAYLLVQKGRASLAGEIGEEFKQLVEQQRGVSRARALTAVPLSDAEREAIAQRLRERTGREVILETEVDPALLGGVVIQIGDRLIDASTRARLKALRASLAGAV